MTQSEFEAALDARFTKIREMLLKTKAAEYAETADHFSNLKAIGRTRSRTPAQVCCDLMAKQLVGVFRIADGTLDAKYLEEKLSDCINYLCILDAISKEQ